MKNFIVYASLAALHFIISFFIYNYSFNVQAAPYLSEEQKVDSGMLMLATTLPAYFIAAIVLTAIFYFVAKRTR